MENKLEQYITGMATGIFVSFTGDFDKDFYQGYLMLVDAVENNKEVEHCLPWHPFEHLEWPKIIELINDHAFSLSQDVIHITNKIKSGMISQSINGTLHGNVNDLDLFALYEAGLNTK